MPKEFQDSDDDEDIDEVQQTYSVLPGLPLLCATKLPSPLALPGTGFLMPSFPRFPAPPPGLSLTPLDSWGDDEAVRRVSPAILSTTPLLATVPLAPSTPHSMVLTPTMAGSQDLLLSTQPMSVKAAKKETCTMGTQTEDATEEETQTEVIDETNGRIRTWSRDVLLRLRQATASDGESLQAQAVGQAEAN